MTARCILLAGLATAAVGCASIEPVRRTALIPAAYLPARTGEPLDDLQVRIQGEANVRMSSHDTPLGSIGYGLVEAGEPGLLIPQAEIGGSVYFAPIEYLEIGGQFRWASYDWTRANKRDVLGFPAGERRDVWTGGLGLRANIPVRRADLTFSPILQVDFVRVPEAEFIDASEVYPGQGYTPGFGFTRMYQKTWIYPAFFLQIDKGFLDSTLHLHFLVGVERTLENVGFDRVERGHSTVESTAVFPIGIGLEYRYEWFVVGATFFYPVATGDRLDADTFGPTLSLRLGAVVGGQEKDEEGGAP